MRAGNGDCLQMDNFGSDKSVLKVECGNGYTNMEVYKNSLDFLQKHLRWVNFIICISKTLKKRLPILFIAVK